MPDKNMFQTKRKIKLFVKVALISFALFFFAPATSHALVGDAEFFNYLNLDYPGMGGVKSAVSANNYTLAKSELLKYYQTRPAYSASTPYGRTWPLAASGDVAVADDNYNHWFTFVSSSMRGFAGTPTINWYNNPFSDPEWLFALNGQEYMKNFGSVYAQTKDEKYALEWIAEIRDWVNDVAPNYGHPDLLRTGSRAESWVGSYQYFINEHDSPSITPNDNIFLLKATKEQADYLSTATPSWNWETPVARGLLVVAVMFPEFKSASGWLTAAAAKIEIHMDDFYSDGGGCTDDAMTYHDVTLRNRYYPYELAKVINNLNAFSANFESRLEKAIEFEMFINKPSQNSPSIGDTDRPARYRGFINTGATLFGRQDMLYVYTSGASGIVPTTISKNYPIGGYTIMRSGWGTASNYNQQLYLALDNSPFGGHGHFDSLNFEAYAYGKDLIIDPARYTYDTTIIDGIDWRSYFRSTKAHSTIVVDNTNQISSAGHSTKDWVTNSGFDYAHGGIVLPSYNHDRKIFFVRNEYWIISDLLTGGGSHTYDQYFHIPKEGWGNTAIDASSKTVTCTANNLKIIPADPATFTSASVISDWEAGGYGFKYQSPTVKYTKTGSTPTTFDTVIYPYSSSAPSVSVSRLAVNRSGTSLPSSTAGGLRIDINSNRDYYFISHDNPVATTYGAFEFNGQVGYIRKNNPNVTVNIQLHDATELKENGAVLATVTGGKSDISSSGGKVEISGAITYFKVWAPSATSVKVNGVIVAFTQNGNYVESTDAPLPPPPPASCTNGVKDGDETGIDCGGTICPACATPVTDTTPPYEITITCPPDNQTYTSPTISLSGTAKDAVGVTSVTVKDGNGVWQPATIVGEGWEVSNIALSSANSGVNTITAKATDAAGNFKEFSIQVTYDSTTPLPPPTGGNFTINPVTHAVQQNGIDVFPMVMFEISSYWADSWGPTTQQAINSLTNFDYSENGTGFGPDGIGANLWQTSVVPFYEANNIWYDTPAKYYNQVSLIPYSTSNNFFGFYVDETEVNPETNPSGWAQAQAQYPLIKAAFPNKLVFTEYWGDFQRLSIVADVIRFDAFTHASEHPSWYEATYGEYVFVAEAMLNQGMIADCGSCTSLNSYPNKSIWIGWEAVGQQWDEGSYTWEPVTPQEMRVEAYWTITTDAKGLGYWTYRLNDWDNGTLYPASLSNNPAQTALYNNLAGEIQSLEPIILLPTVAYSWGGPSVGVQNTKVTFSPNPVRHMNTWVYDLNYFSYSLKQSGNTYYLFVANKSSDTINNVEINITGLNGLMTAKVLGSSTLSYDAAGRTVPVSEGKFTDNFQGFAGRVYQIYSGPIAPPLPVGSSGNLPPTCTPPSSNPCGNFIWDTGLNEVCEKTTNEGCSTTSTCNSSCTQCVPNTCHS
ncbi:heparinase II/III family protein, partial [Candidatus Parcubacteria bacterium]|nr:heparinase II/III family protein [Candidatus Parcubacteria bacterium]